MAHISLPMLPQWLTPERVWEMQQHDDIGIDILRKLRSAYFSLDDKRPPEWVEVSQRDEDISFSLRIIYLSALEAEWREQFFLKCSLDWQVIHYLGVSTKYFGDNIYTVLSFLEDCSRTFAFRLRSEERITVRHAITKLDELSGLAALPSSNVKTLEGKIKTELGAKNKRLIEHFANSFLSLGIAWRFNRELLEDIADNEQTATEAYLKTISLIANLCSIIRLTVALGVCADAISDICYKPRL